MAATQRPNAIKPSAQVPFRAVGLSRPTNGSPSYSVARPPPQANAPHHRPDNYRPFGGAYGFFGLPLAILAVGAANRPRLYLRFGDVSLARGGRNTRDGRVTSSRRDAAIMAAGQPEHASPSKAQSPTTTTHIRYDNITVRSLSPLRILQLDTTQHNYDILGPTMSPLTFLESIRIVSFHLSTAQLTTVNHSP